MRACPRCTGNGWYPITEWLAEGERITGHRCCLCGHRDYTDQSPVASPRKPYREPKRAMVHCLECGVTRPGNARGLCCSCYSRLLKRGLLDEKYPLQPRPAKAPITRHVEGWGPVAVPIHPSPQN